LKINETTELGGLFLFLISDMCFNSLGSIRTRANELDLYISNYCWV